MKTKKVIILEKKIISRKMINLLHILIYYIYIYIGYSKKVKNIFSKRFDVCLHQSILFTTHLKIFYYILQ